MAKTTARTLQIVFFSQLLRPPKAQFKESEFEPCKVEQRGYVPLKIQVEELLAAGKQLEQFRKERYDFGWDEVSVKTLETYEDPTQVIGYTAMDALDAQRDLEESILLQEELNAQKSETFSQPQETPENAPDEAGEPLGEPETADADSAS